VWYSGSGLASALVQSQVKVARQVLDVVVVKGRHSKSNSSKLVVVKETIFLVLSFFSFFSLNLKLSLLLIFCFFQELNCEIFFGILF
jgi:hypothetical protein